VALKRAVSMEARDSGQVGRGRGLGGHEARAGRGVSPASVTALVRLSLLGEFLHDVEARGEAGASAVMLRFPRCLSPVARPASGLWLRSERDRQSDECEGSSVGRGRTGG